MSDPIDDPSALALVIDDPNAPAFLAWWDRRGHKGAPIDEAAFVCRATPFVVEQVKTRCEMAGLLVDTGITPLARKFVQTVVSQRLNPPKRKPVKPGS